MSLISSLLMGLAILSIALIPLEILWPGVARQRRFRRGWLLDVVYWFFNALITKPISQVAVVIALSPLLFLTGYGSFENLLKGMARSVVNHRSLNPCRWSFAEEGRDKNFAGLLPLWDIWFGTYYMPGKRPKEFGVPDPVPADLIGQIIWPFRRRHASL